MKRIKKRELKYLIRICRRQNQKIDLALIKKAGCLFRELFQIGMHMNDRGFEWQIWIPHGSDWHLLKANCMQNWLYVSLDHIVVLDVILQEDGFDVEEPGVDVFEEYEHPVEVVQAPKKNIEILMDWLILETQKCLQLVKNGTYKEEILEHIPDTYRNCLVIKKNIHRRALVRSRAETGLTHGEELYFQKLEKVDYRMVVRPDPHLDLPDIIHGFAEAVNVNSWYREDCSNEWDIFFKYMTDARTKYLKDGTLSFDEWFDRFSFKMGSYQTVFLSRKLPIGLNICKDEEGYFLQILCNRWDKIEDTIRCYLVMVGLGLPVWLPNAKDYADILEGIERIAVIPESYANMNQAERYVPNTFVTDELLASDELYQVEYPDHILWAPLHDLWPISTKEKMILVWNCAKAYRWFQNMDKTSALQL